MKHLITTVAFLCFQSLLSQAISGNLYDTNTGRSIDGASVYFDGSSIGTITDEQGFFSIDPKFNSNTYLVFSHIGYKTVILEYQKLGRNLRIEMEEEFFEVPEVVLVSDPFSRKQKLEVFRLEFLGESMGGERSEILNEEALELYFNSKTNVLTASANESLIIVNEHLGYRIHFDLMDFQVQFKTKSLERIENIRSTIIYGYTFFVDVSNSKKNYVDRRNNAYFGSIQHFIRTIWNSSWFNEAFELRKDLKKIYSSDVFTVSAGPDVFSKKVSFKLKDFKITYKKGLFKHWSSLKLLSGNSIVIDKYGSYRPYLQLKFGGEMADDRVGSLLPLDFEVYEIVD